MAAGMNAPLYTTEILRLAASLDEPRRLEREDGRAEMRSPTCGSTVEVAVQLDRRKRILGLSQRVHACAFGQASATLMERGAIGRGRDEIAEAVTSLTVWLAGEREDPGHWPGIGALTPAIPRKSRHGAIILPFRALLAAIESAE